jgi:hypothetical protein
MAEGKQTILSGMESALNFSKKIAIFAVISKY